MSIRYRAKYTKWLILVSLSLLVAVPYCIFPSTKDYRTLIQEAARVDLQYSLFTGCSKRFTMATIPGSDKASLDKLSNSIGFRGVWTPFRDVSGGVYTISITRDDGSVEDIAVHSADSILCGNWSIRVSEEAVQTIKQVVVESGGQLPDKDVRTELFRQLEEHNPPPCETQEAADDIPPP